MTRTAATPSLAEAHSLLASLAVGDAVTLTQDGRAVDLTVQAAIGGGFGHPHSSTVTVGYGPGRYNRELSAATLAYGFVTLTITEPATTTAAPKRTDPADLA